MVSDSTTVEQKIQNVTREIGAGRIKNGRRVALIGGDV